VTDNADATAADGEAARPTDASLARQVQAGDADAFEELARRYLRPVYAVVGSLLAERADIEDVAQETFLRALDRIETFDPARPFAPWLYQIARNTARNHRKARLRRAADSSDVLALPARGPDVEARVLQKEIRQFIDAALERLPEQQRSAFRLFDIGEHSAEEVASLMGISAGTVRTHVHHARRALRELLAPLLAAEAVK
jgi:RNA polymerase sigma-70 factor (ECF subfamily)